MRNRITYWTFAFLFLITALSCNSNEENSETKDTTLTMTAPPGPVFGEGRSSLDSGAVAGAGSGTSGNFDSASRRHALERALGHDTSYLAKATPPRSGAPVDTGRRVATLCLSYYNKMKLHETKLLKVWVSVRNGQQEMLQEMRVDDSTDHVTNGEKENATIITRSISVYDSVRVKLLYDTSEFIVEPVVSKEAQRIDPNNNTEWQWRITAISTEDRSGKITVRVEGITPPGAPQPLRPIDIKIRVQFDFLNMIRSWLVWLWYHPKYTITGILVPSIGFLVRAWLRRKRRTNDKTQKPLRKKKITELKPVDEPHSIEPPKI